MSGGAPDVVAKAKAFAQALDRDDFTTTERMLATDCDYVHEGERVQGARAIVARYQQGSQKAARLFDEVGYDHELEVAGPGHVVILFKDILRRGQLQHTYHIRQRLTFDAEGSIIHIRTLEVPGERESLQAFLESCGLDSAL